MKLAISTYSMWRWMRERGTSLEQALDWIAANVDAVEFAGFDEKTKSDPLKRAAQLRRHAEKRKLRIVSYCVGAELLVLDGEKKRVIDQLKREVDVAAELGVPSMRHDVTRGQGATSFPATLKLVLPAIREVADYAQSKGVKTSLENHGFYMQAAERVEKLIKAIAHPNFALTIDMGNFLCVNDDPVKAVARLAKYAVMAHVKDFHVKKKAKSPGAGWFDTPTGDCLMRGASSGMGRSIFPSRSSF